MGALTNKPMAFNSRNWEYSSQITNDLTDFLTPRIRVDQFSGKIYRILPTIEWISNKIRFLYLGLRNQRVLSPLFSYNYSIKIDLRNKILYLNKTLILTNRLEKAFSVLRKRISNSRSKRVNVILGSVFDANLELLTNNAKVNKYLEFDGLVNNSGFSLDENNYIFFGVNPRMESPLLSLKIKESQKNVYSVGNFSFQYRTLDNSTFAVQKGIEGKLLADSFAFFGLGSMTLSKSYQGKKCLLLPIYFLNNLRIAANRFTTKVENQLDDVTVALMPQNLLTVSSKFLCLVTTHFEKISGAENIIRIPVSGYLETSISYKDKDGNSKKINSMKPSFGISDFALAFGAFNKRFSELLDGEIFSNISTKKRINNQLLSNNIPNYLVRDPITRANQLFVKR